MPVPNQNIITIHRDMPQSNFLQIKNEHWPSMLKNTHDTYAFALYMYFASNANGYRLEISPEAIANAIGMPRSTYYKKFDLLQEKGYIISIGKNSFAFYEVPQKQNQSSGSPSENQNNLPERIVRPQHEQKNLSQEFANSSCEQNCSSENKEINNRYIINDIDNANNTRQSQKPKEAFIF